jgi:hypothetical protein
MNEPDQHMIKKRHILRAFLVIIALTGSFLIYRSAAGTASTDSSCKESMDCLKQQEKEGKMIWESLPQQFFSSI